ncbi:hypothetical protein MTR67_002438 [Solanum verrucosum]|uniref:Uncharacterized protein n=1 Tax=Solanum verrucosum TaxID=315347 RepID=A0AAF0T9E5_SOLVR|nr:hypothetical protein MTR67_002438 [Solanum verrucosum]
MSKYFINGYTFHTEEWSKGKKTNNSGVWVKGEGDIDYYGVLQEIIEFEYVVGWPKKKLVIFRCKCYDPDTIFRSGVGNCGIHRNGNVVGGSVVGELQHSEGIYEEFDTTVLQSYLNNYGEGSSRVNEEESQTDEYEQVMRNYLKKMK